MSRVRAVLSSSLFLISAAVIGLAGSAHAAAGLEEFTGAHARIVWVQDLSESSSDTMARGKQLRLMGYDSRDGRGERVIIAGPGSYAKPLLTRDGSRVVVSSRHENSFIIVNWDGSGKRRVHDGYAIHVWQDPAGGAPWVYYLSRSRKSGERHVDVPVRRRRLDGEPEDQLVWDATPITPDNFQVSRDGRHCAGLFPWPNAGLAALPNGRWQKFSKGCWTSLAPDDSLIAWAFDGQHRNIYLHTRGGTKWRVPIAVAPGIDGYEVYHPRWSNHVRFMVMTGPYLGEGGKPGGNRIRAGGRNVEIYIGRFGSDYRSMEAWHKLTRNRVGDFYPDMWLADAGSQSVPDDVSEAGDGESLDDAALAAMKRWPGSHDGLVFLWENSKKSNDVLDAGGGIVRSCGLRLSGRAIYDRYFDLVLDRGTATPEKVDAALLSECRESNQLAIEFVITPASAGDRAFRRIITFSSEGQAGNFTVGQQRDRLVLRLRTSDSVGADGKVSAVPLCNVTPGVPQHVIVSYSPGRLRCLRNGEPVALPENLSGDLGNWTAQKVKLGDAWGGGRDWSGKLEGITISARAIGAAEAARRFELYRAKIASRGERHYAKVRAKLVEKSTRLTLEQIAPYRRCLVANIYDVVEVLEGECDQDRISIARWSMLGGEMLPDDDKVGATCEFLIEAADEQTHPELTSERMSVEVDNLLLDHYIALERKL